MKKVHTSVLKQRLACTVHAEHEHVQVLYNVCLLILQHISIHVIAPVLCADLLPVVWSHDEWCWVDSKSAVITALCDWKPASRLPQVVTRQLRVNPCTHWLLFSQAGRNPFPQVPTEEILQFREPPEKLRGIVCLLPLCGLLGNITDEDAETRQG